MHDLVKDFKPLSKKELMRFTNGKEVDKNSMFDIYDLIAIADNMKRIDYDHYKHSILGIMHDVTNGDPIKMEYLFDKMIEEGIIPKEVL